MAKFNTTNSNKTVNRSGFPAYKMADKERLVTAVLTTMFGEPKFYGTTDNDIVRLAAQCAHMDPAFLCKLACYARNEGNLRSVSHVLTCVIAHEASAYTRTTIRNVCIRPDDITEIMACYLSMYGKPFPNAMKREIAEVIQTFDEYQLAKYAGEKKSVSLRDVLRIAHPVPRDEETAALFRKVLDGTLKTPYTWESELSARGNTRQVWEELIASGKVGYMALLRNLRNIVKSGADIGPVLEILSDPQQVRKSRQLPFRFYSVYRTLSHDKLLTPEIRRALDRAIAASVENMEPIMGRTLIAVDISASMISPISSHSSITCHDIAALLAALAKHLCEDATICYFQSEYAPGESYRIADYGKHDSILDICIMSPYGGGGTNFSMPMKFALMEDPDRNIRPFDRIVYFSDNECNSSRGFHETVQELIDHYRENYNKDFWVHGVDLQGYGTQQFCGNRFNLIAGWSERVLPFINLAEAGISTLVDTIAAYELKQ